MSDYLLCADWSKDQNKRALYAADVRKREVYRVRPATLTIDSALDEARKLAAKGKVLLSFDLPLGLPLSFLSAIRTIPGWETASRFDEFLTLTARTPSFFEFGRDANGWSVQKPFFKVPEGEGALGAFDAAAQRAGVKLRRRIDERTGGRPVFITAGIPGSVGSAAIDAWKRLARLLPEKRDFKLWPFEGTLPNLFASTRIVVAENYPRATNAAALSDLSAVQCPRLKVSKGVKATRRAAVDHLLSRPWVVQHDVTLMDIDAALDNEDDFDAFLTAAGLLRLVLEGERLCSPDFEDAIAEGGILGTGTINLELPEEDFSVAGGARNPRVGTKAPRASIRRGSEPARENPRLRPTYRCPIPECSRLFYGSRSGWDGHVGSPRMHPNWHPEVTDHGERRERFRAEFPQFFA